MSYLEGKAIQLLKDITAKFDLNTELTARLLGITEAYNNRSMSGQGASVDQDTHLRGLFGNMHPLSVECVISYIKENYIDSRPRSEDKESLPVLYARQMDIDRLTLGKDEKVVVWSKADDVWNVPLYTLNRG